MSQSKTSPTAPAGQNSEAKGGAAMTPQFAVGQLVLVGWDKLGEVVGYIGDDYYLVWVETDYMHSDAVRVHANKLEAL